METVKVKATIDHIVKWLNEYKERTNCRGVVVGISGGKDSTVVAMLAKKVWGDNVCGVLMPYGNQSDIVDSYRVVQCLGLKNRTIGIMDSDVVLRYDIEHWNKLDSPISLSSQAKINIKPRLRMTVLYAIAQTLGYRVIGTGNASERYIGWFTKWGDGAYDVNPIANLTCSEVVEIGIELAKEFNLDEELVKKVPADGLTDKSDEANFGFTYTQLDAVIKGKTDGIPDDVLETISRRHQASLHKFKPDDCPAFREMPE